MQGSEHPDAHVMREPPPALVAKIIDENGMPAAMERWYWLSNTRLLTIARAERASHGHIAVRRRANRSFTDEQAAITLEAAFALGSTIAGARAAALRSLPATTHIASLRGIALPSGARFRGPNMQEAKRAAGGDVAAQARIAARRDHELAVGAVIRTALALVTEPQPTTGRYRLPPVSPELVAALAGHPVEAVEAVFPGLVAPVPVHPITEEVTVWQIKSEPRRGAVRRAPLDDVIRTDFDTMSAKEMAVKYRMSTVSVYSHLKRLGLSKIWPVETAPVTSTAHDTEIDQVEESTTEPVRSLASVKPAALAKNGRLFFDDLLLVAELVQYGIAVEIAVQVVRADAAGAS